MAGQRIALIVANGDYRHEGLRRLQAPVQDAQALAGVLGDPRIGDFDVRVIHDEDAHRIQVQIEHLFSKAKSDDVLLLHFSCHGLKNVAGHLFFAARSTRPDLLASTAISADFVQGCMRASRSRSIVLFLDCCFGGAFGKGASVKAAGDLNVMDSFSGEGLGGGRGRAVIAASNSMQFAFEGDTLADDHSRGPSVFTNALVNGLATGDADLDQDGRVSLNELYDYVFDRVREANPNQTPTCDIAMQGELYLAFSGRQGASIPPELRVAMADPNMLTRLGAVTDLRSLLAGENLSVAKAAFDALAKMADTDISVVADAAADALREARLQVSEATLGFGRVDRHSSPPHRVVHVGGLPLARAYTIESSHDWIRVAQTPEGLVVSVDTSHPGALEGRISLTGPTGAVVVPVAVEVTAEPVPTPKPGRQLATWSSRVAAFLIDTAPILIVALFVLIGTAINPTIEQDLSSLGGLAIIGWMAYNRWIKQGKTGQSLGKRVMKIELIDERTGRPVGGGRALARDLAHFIDVAPFYLGLLAPLWDDKNRTFSDMIMTTLVVTANPGNAP